jgi:protein-S-isoprenylcysteine O-methyltransferase Ste14
MLLFFRNLFWTILIPGVVTAYIPSLIVAQTPPPPSWGFVQWLALPVGVIGLIVLLYCILSFAVIGRGTLSPIDAPKLLVVRGLYRYVRNPMYCGVFLILIAEATFYESRSLLEYAAIWLPLAQAFVVLYEEPHLRREYGDSYDHYCQSVRRWLPGKPYDASYLDSQSRKPEGV